MSYHVTNIIWNIRALTPTQKLVLVCLGDFANNSFIAWPSLATICTNTGLSKSTVKRCIDEFEKLHILSVAYEKSSKDERIHCVYTLYKDRLLELATPSHLKSAPNEPDMDRVHSEPVQGEPPQGSGWTLSKDVIYPDRVHGEPGQGPWRTPTGSRVNPDRVHLEADRVQGEPPQGSLTPKDTYYIDPSGEPLVLDPSPLPPKDFGTPALPVQKKEEEELFLAAKEFATDLKQPWTRKREQLYEALDIFHKACGGVLGIGQPIREVGHRERIVKTSEDAFANLLRNYVEPRGLKKFSVLLEHLKILGAYIKARKPYQIRDREISLQELCRHQAWFEEWMEAALATKNDPVVVYDQPMITKTPFMQAIENSKHETDEERQEGIKLGQDLLIKLGAQKTWS